MVKYAAFLRGVNVGGHNRIKMDSLSKVCAAIGCSDIKTYIQSGNVSFEFKKTDEEEIARKLKKELSTKLKIDVAVFIRSIEHLRMVMAHNPFETRKKSDEEHHYLTFISKLKEMKKVAPLTSPKGDVEVVQLSSSEAWSISRKVGGQVGYPNVFIESTLGLIATTRNPDTIKNILDVNKT